jgi:hypothetical protein
MIYERLLRAEGLPGRPNRRPKSTQSIIPTITVAWLTFNAMGPGHKGQANAVAATIDVVTYRLGPASHVFEFIESRPVRSASSTGRY